MVDEVEQRIVGPVQVVEYEDEGALVAEPLEEAAPRGECLVAAVAAAAGTARQADERPQMRLDPRIVDDFRELARRLGLVVAFEDSRLRLDHLRERPERDALAVGHAAPMPPVGDLRLRLDLPVELEDEAALADPGHADEGHELGRALQPRAVERAAE